jgi:hypothetical protein
MRDYVHSLLFSGDTIPPTTTSVDHFDGEWSIYEWHFGDIVVLLYVDCVEAFWSITRGVESESSLGIVEESYKYDLTILKELLQLLSRPHSFDVSIAEKKFKCKFFEIDSIVREHFADARSIYLVTEYINNNIDLIVRGEIVRIGHFSCSLDSPA